MGRSRVVGIDFGLARVGLAISDPLGVFAQPIGTYSPDEALSELARLHGDEGIAKIVLGWPIDLDGAEGESVKHAVVFERRLKNSFPGLTIVRWDERFSSKEAVEAIVASGARKSKRRQKGSVDTVAAAIILQSYLDQ